MRSTLIAAALCGLFAAGGAVAQDHDPLNPPAPAAATSKPSWMEYRDQYTGEQNDLKNANRSQDEILSWAQELAANVLTLAPANLSDRLREFKPKFSEAGWNQYAAFMRDSGLVDKIRAQNLQLDSVGSGNASVLNSGAVGGTYRWLVEIPVMLTVSRPAIVAEGALPESIGTIGYRLRLQLGRAATRADEALSSTGGGDGILIESWEMTQARN